MSSSNYSTTEVLELRFDPAEHEVMAEKLAELVPLVGERMEALPDRVLVYTDDGDAAATTIRGRGLLADSALVRRSTLEDVFLRLTGRTLVD